MATRSRNIRTSNKEVNKLSRIAKNQGWDVTRMGDHLKFQPRGRSEYVTVSCTPGANPEREIAQLRALGLVIPGYGPATPPKGSLSKGLDLAKEAAGLPDPETGVGMVDLMDGARIALSQMSIHDTTCICGKEFMEETGALLHRNKCLHFKRFVSLVDKHE